MHLDLSKIEFDTNNPEPRCPCISLLDTSCSISGKPTYGQHPFNRLPLTPNYKMVSWLFWIIIILFIGWIISYESYTNQVYTINNQLLMKQTLLDKAHTQLAMKQTLLNEANAQLTTKQTLLNEANAQLTTKQTLLDEANAQLTSKQTLLDEANAQLATTQTLLDEANKKLPSEQIIFQHTKDKLVIYESAFSKIKTMLLRQAIRDFNNKGRDGAEPIIQIIATFDLELAINFCQDQRQHYLNVSKRRNTHVKTIQKALVSAQEWESMIPSSN